MVTDRTPIAKRVVRAEKGRDEWKAKAVERRLERERLSAINTEKILQIEALKQANDDLQQRLAKAMKKISEQEKKVEDLKKNSSKQQR